MRVAGYLGLLVLVFAGACHREKKPEPARAEPSASSGGLAGLGGDPATPPSPPLDLGPAAGTRAERERAVWALIRGEQSAARLPEVATENGKALDLSLRDQLAPRSGGLADLEDRKGAVTVRDVTASAGIENGQRMMAMMRAGFRACYNRGLAETPGAQGVVKLVIHVTDKGEVDFVDAKVEGKLPDAVTSCIKARAKSAQLGATGAGTVKATLELAPQT